MFKNVKQPFSSVTFFLHVKPILLSYSLANWVVGAIPKFNAVCKSLTKLPLE